MQCEDVTKDLHAYVLGDLPPDERRAIESHLATCSACAEEAAAMQDVGERLSNGLKEWVDQGICPPELLTCIENSLKAERKRRPWYRTIPAYAGAVAAAAVLMLLIGGSMGYSEQIASIPFVGTLAAQLFYPNTGDQAVDVNISHEQNGIIFTVKQVSMTKAGTRVTYALQGDALDLQAAPGRFEARLAGPNGPVTLRNMNTVSRGTNSVDVTATYDPVLPGHPVTLSVAGVPLRTGSEAKGNWQVTFKP